ncbi:GlcG/HbpS family heme-binding protein [Aliamphritea ceti]|uniref:GlcG/HbpS family heme-binding protein n=1 Tax=Aliamphritea ceti TaxID=1524258 RepID=UPI0021C3AE76|nr:heme-binding protein [Aliamphritea ceti]
MLIQETSLNWQSAQQICQASCEYATAQSLRICVWVLDRHGNPLAMQRINHAPLPSTDIARDKAHTAVSFGFGTHLWQQRLADKPHLLSGLTTRPDMVLFGGGLPIKHNGQLIGAIGVSGASESQDQECAAAGIASFPELQSA